MGFFTRIFAPLVESLRLQLKHAEAINEWWREKFQILTAENHELRNEISYLKEQLKLETRSNRLREDAFTAKILMLAGAPGITERETLKTKTPDVSAQNDLNEGELALLKSRAEDYCEQQIGTEYTPEQFNGIFNAMLENPHDWLTN